MLLKILPISQKVPQYNEVLRLMKTAFPANEQIPVWLLKLLALQKGVEFNAFYDENNLCGISYTIENKTMIFVFYLAVNDNIRSKGYGSRILQYVKEHAGEKNIVLNVEAIKPDAPNLEQRKSRIRFYQKNGIEDTRYTFADGGEAYSVLSSDPTHFQPQEYEQLLKEFSLGLYRQKIAVT